MAHSPRHAIKEGLRQALGNIQSAQEKIASVRKTFADNEYPQEEHSAEVILQGLELSYQLLEIFEKSI